MNAARLISFYLPVALMAVSLLAAIGIGALFFLKRSGEMRANRLYGGLLIAGGLTQLHFLLLFSGLTDRHPALEFLPIYFTLWLPVLLFFHVKLSLYPHYRLRWTDLKHFIFPLAQLLFFVSLWVVPSFRRPEGRYFYSPFYGGLEQALYLIIWPAYIIFAYQYLRRKRAQLRRRSLPRLLWYLRKLLKGSMLFVIAYAILAVSDFISYNYLFVDLRNREWYAGVQSLSYTVLLLWLTTYGFQVLLWGRRLLRAESFD
ncbi:hypothetical protein GGR28_002081 [Lewinella aquimaris]|uniref:Uncharacterized protein n=1 Tax=Neolewinella aquimaris TaxID=1835722 RepID=A0A840EET7_9BACT|nr:hypothetical protein [Neolewinella aquimaris]MBB4079456.1 hypothetical protein [Neolewinella aquimaris]